MNTDQKWGSTHLGCSRSERLKKARIVWENYNAIAEALADLGCPEEIGAFFAGFQKHLYQPSV